MARGVWSSCLIKHEVQPHGNSTTPECHKSHNGRLVNFKWFIVHFAPNKLAFPRRTLVEKEADPPLFDIHSFLVIMNVQYSGKACLVQLCNIKHARCL